MEILILYSWVELLAVSSMKEIIETIFNVKLPKVSVDNSKG